MLPFNILEICFWFWKYRCMRNVLKKRRDCNRPTPSTCPVYVFRTEIQKNWIGFRTFETNFFNPRVGFLRFFLVCFCRSRLCWRISGLCAITWIFITDDRVRRRHIMAFRGFCPTTVCAKVLFHEFVFFIIDNRKLTTFFLPRVDS